MSLLPWLLKAPPFTAVSFVVKARSLIPSRFSRFQVGRFIIVTVLPVSMSIFISCSKIIPLKYIPSSPCGPRLRTVLRVVSGVDVVRASPAPAGKALSSFPGPSVFQVWLESFLARPLLAVAVEFRVGPLPAVRSVLVQHSAAMCPFL